MPLSRLIALIINARPKVVRRTSADAPNRKTGTESERPLLVQDLSAARGLACVTGNRLPAPVHPCGRTQTNPFFTMSNKMIAPPGGAPGAETLKRVARKRAEHSALQPNWWSQTGSNRRPHACKARALPTELWPLRPCPAGAGTGERISTFEMTGYVHQKTWWAWDDSNVRPHAYQACALTT
jgi:hypothetical protein